MNKTLTAILLLAALILAACAGPEAPAPTAEPVPPTTAAAAAPTDLPAPTDPPPTAEPTAPADYIDTLAHTADPELIDIAWQWVSRADSSGATTLTVPDPAAYTVEFFAEGTFNAQLDCNSGNGRYATASPGEIFMALGPVTMAECSQQSLAIAMANLFGPAQTYRIEDDGQTLILEWAGGGGSDSFRHPDAPPIPVVTATPEATTAAEPTAEAAAPEATAEATAAPLPEGPAAVVNAPDGIFVRSGPGTQFADIGVLATGEAAPILGRSADGQWWAIEVPLTWAADRQGWVSAQFVDASGAEEVPVLEASAPATAVPAPTLDPAATPDAAATAAPTAVPAPADPGTSGGATGIQFRVVSFGAPGGEQSLIEGTTITALFSDTDVVGSAGCNDYSGRLTPVEDYFTIGGLAVTERSCAEPAGIMEQEQAYLAALAGTTGFEWARQIVDGSTVITAGQLFYTLGDGTTGVINLVAGS